MGSYVTFSSLVWVFPEKFVRLPICKPAAAARLDGILHPVFFQSIAYQFHVQHICSRSYVKFRKLLLYKYVAKLDLSTNTSILHHPGIARKWRARNPETRLQTTFTSHEFSSPTFEGKKKTPMHHNKFTVAIGHNPPTRTVPPHPSAPSIIDYLEGRG